MNCIQYNPRTGLCTSLRLRTAGGRGQRCGSRKKLNHRLNTLLNMVFFRVSTGANRALFSLWLLSLLSKRKRESDSVPPLGKRGQVVPLTKRNAIIKLKACALDKG